MADVGDAEQASSPPAPTDYELLARFGLGDATAMDVLVDRYQADLLRTAHAVLGSADQAQDAVQESFLRLCREHHRLTPGALGGWLTTVVRNQCIDVLRAHRPTRSVHSDTPALTTPSEPLEPDPLWDAVERLPALERAAIVLRYRDGLSYQDIADRLGKTVTHIGVMLNQAMTRLRTNAHLREAYSNG